MYEIEDVENQEEICIASKLEFDTADGKHVVPPNLHDIPQHNSVPPVIADTLTCRTSPDSIYFTVSYSPNCNFDECLHINYFSLEGKQVSRNGIPTKDFLSTGNPDFNPIPPISLRGDQNEPIPEFVISRKTVSCCYSIGFVL